MIPTRDLWCENRNSKTVEKGKKKNIKEREIKTDRDEKKWENPRQVWRRRRRFETVCISQGEQVKVNVSDLF